MDISNLPLIIFLVLLNIIFILNYKYLAQIINIYDNPSEERKIHKTPVPILGGIFLFLNFIFFVIYGFFFDVNLLFDIFIHSEIKGLIYFLIILSLIFLIGLYDDKYKIRPLVRLISLSILIYFMIKLDQRLLIKSIDFSFSDLIINFNIGIIFLSYFSIIALLIACNMSDGINLQSAIFYLLNFCTLYFINPNTFILMIIFVLIIFSLLNSTGKIFLGDSGVYFLSIMLSFYYIKYYSFNNDLKADHIFLFLFFPVLDASRCFVSRLIVGKSIFLADDKHFHHILLKKINYKKTIIILSSIYLIPFVGYFFEINSVFLLISIMMIYFILLIRYKS